MTFVLLSLITSRKDLINDKTDIEVNDLVSFIVPVYEEESTILDTIKSLKELEYKHVEFILLNDGSKDNSAKIIAKGIHGDSRFTFIDNEVNKGKAATLNQGIALAKGKYVACMDGDSIVEPKILNKSLPYFSNEKVGSVTVSVEVSNPKTILQKIISVEFSLGLSLMLKLFSFLNCVFVTPGPFSIYRKSAVNEIGGFDINNITEDHEIAFRLHKAGYKIENCMEAKVFTELPDTFKGIYVQRRRWYSGSILTFFQHKDVLLKPKYGVFGFFIPFNFFLILSGLSLFIFSTFLFIKKAINYFIYYGYTNFNFFENWKFEFDLLAFGQVNLFGMSMFLTTLLFILVGFSLTQKKFKNYTLGLIGFPLFFIYYQIFWIGSIFQVLKGGKIKWR
ncbi:glycosyltransferase [Candidatus Woesearchaeota archaeon]|nr:glycosyltransferase [Candidatus Woesearchaeota archaeon]